MCESVSSYWCWIVKKGKLDDIRLDCKRHDRMLDDNVTFFLFTRREKCKPDDVNLFHFYFSKKEKVKEVNDCWMIVRWEVRNQYMWRPLMKGKLLGIFGVYDDLVVFSLIFIMNLSINLIRRVNHECERKTPHHHILNLSNNHSVDETRFLSFKHWIG